jgi:ribosomal protein L37AE/L43A
MGKEVDFNGLMKAPPRCPLCHKKMELRYDPVRNVKIFVCDTERIAINAMDPLVGRWEEKREEKVLCPMPGCERNVRLFFTSVGFLMAKCPKCGAIVKGSNPDRFTMAPALLNDGVKDEGEKK